jgi:hypothetical protein
MKSMTTKTPFTSIGCAAAKYLDAIQTEINPSFHYVNTNRNTLKNIRIP